MDSVKKITKEFKKLGYVLSDTKELDYLVYFQYYFEDKHHKENSYTIEIECDLIKRSFKIIASTCYGNEAVAVYINAREYKLINRILVLYGLV